MGQKPSLVGGACIIAGVCVGAGMLGLPSAGAGAWTIWSVLAITLTMIVMTVSGWMLLESYQGYPLRVSFDTVTRELLDDLLYVFAQSIEGTSTICDHDSANEVVSRYTDKPFTYSDGSPVGIEYLDADGFVCYQAFKPPHRRFYCNETGETDN